MEQINKLDILKQHLADLGSAAVAFSGGADSAFLLKTAYDVLGSRAAAVTVQSCIFPMRELEEAKALCADLGVRHMICTVDALKIEGFVQNPQNRCYLCKHEMLSRILETAKEQNLACVMEGSNIDDEGDYRPGHQAVAELGVESPLRKAGMTKADIRAYSKSMGLPTWKKPSCACLASRFVYGETITEEKLAMVDRAEQLLMDLGFGQMRVRIHDKMARIEVQPEEFQKLVSADIRERIMDSFKSWGFSYITMDLAGYRTGSMNEVLEL